VDSKPRAAWVATALALLGAAAVAFRAQQGHLLYYGDAAAHLNIARRIVDSRTPGADQIGTVWLPLPHLLMLPFVWIDALWTSGLAGALMSVPMYILGGVLLYRLLLMLSSDRTAALVGLAAAALNPNLLYLQALPMTEALMFAASIGLFYAVLRFCARPGITWVLWGAIAANAASLTRYEGWFLTGVAAICMAWPFRLKQIRLVMLFCALASAGPLAWLAHNWWYYGDPLEFYHGQYSAKAIYQRALDSGGFRAPGDGDWLLAARYFWEASRLAAGSWMLVLGVAGGVVAAVRGWWRILMLAAAAPFFYVWSLHSSGTPIFVPTLWPHSYYNTRYAVSALPLLAVGVTFLARRSFAMGLGNRKWDLSLAFRAAAVLALLLPWTAPSICWEESRVNSTARRQWTGELARFLRREHVSGVTIFTASGDLMAAYTEAGIPFRDLVFDGNNPEYVATLRFPRQFLTAQWVIAQQGDEVHGMAKRRRLPLQRRIDVAGAAPVLIYRGR
jgi:hypothetical protein